MSAIEQQTPRGAAATGFDDRESPPRIEPFTPIRDDHSDAPAVGAQRGDCSVVENVDITHDKESQRVDDGRSRGLEKSADR